MVAWQGILWEEEQARAARSGTLRFAPTPPKCTYGPYRASASSSCQPGVDGFLEDWCAGLERPEVPW
jgi:hypothetical protein